MDRRFLFCLAGVSALGTPSLRAQMTTTPPPTPIVASQVPSMPVYAQPGAPLVEIPTPAPAPQPVVAPATPTRDAPYVAMPAYVPPGVPAKSHKKEKDVSVDGGVDPEKLWLFSPREVNTIMAAVAGEPRIERTDSYRSGRPLADEYGRTIPAKFRLATATSVPGGLVRKDTDGSVYVPLDSWIYPEMTRLYSLGYVDTMFLGMRPWTRKSLLHMLGESEDAILHSNSEEAQGILAAVMRELRSEDPENGLKTRGLVYGSESQYARLMPIAGQTLRDSYHLGQTIANDYGRPYQPGFNMVAGASTVEEFGRFSLYVRGEYQHSPSATGYSQVLSAQLSNLDEIPFSGYNLNQATIPTRPIAAQNPFRLVEATLSVHLAGHEISGGKSDAWLGPAQGGAVAWSNNAEDIYSFRINRVEPLHIPLLSRVLGPVRYDFFYGALKGHTDPNDDWTHAEMISFRPTKNFEFGFERTIIFGGKGHEPVTLHNFLYGFFDGGDTNGTQKYSRTDPGARFSVFNFSYRLPFIEKYATLYVDSIAHDDVTPISAPRRAAYRTGVDLSQVPGLRKLEFRAEAVTTDPGVSRSFAGQFNYFEIVQLQGYTNKGYIMGDWIGREAKGGQAWFTYHLSGNEWIQAEYLNKKNEKDFIGGGTTQNQWKAQVVKRFLHNDLELNAWVQYERWKAPIYLPGLQTNTTTAIQLTFFPGLKNKSFR